MLCSIHCPLTHSKFHEENGQSHPLRNFPVKVGNESKNKIKLFKGVQHQKEEVWDKLKNEIKRQLIFSIYTVTERIITLTTSNFGHVL